MLKSENRSWNKRVVAKLTVIAVKTNKQKNNFHSLEGVKNENWQQSIFMSSLYYVIGQPKQIVCLRCIQAE